MVVVVIWYLVSSLYVSSHALRGKVVPGAVLKFQSFPPYVGDIKMDKMLSSFFLLQMNTFKTENSARYHLEAF